MACQTWQRERQSPTRGLSNSTIEVYSKKPFYECSFTKQQYGMVKPKIAEFNDDVMNYCDDAVETPFDVKRLLTDERNEESELCAHEEK